MDQSKPATPGAELFHVDQSKLAIPARVGDVLQPGQGLRTQPGTTAKLKYPDGTTLEIKELTELALQKHERAKRLYLRGAPAAQAVHGAQATHGVQTAQSPQGVHDVHGVHNVHGVHGAPYDQSGELIADVFRQPAGAPLVVTTPQAEAQVPGTRFTLRAERDKTRLEVAEGKVQLTRTADRTTVEVAGEYYAVAAVGVELAARSLGAMPYHMACLSSWDVLEPRG